jgi:spore coat protein A, manganese oxidase
MKKAISIMMIICMICSVTPSIFFEEANAQPSSNLIDPQSIPQWTNQLVIPPVYVPQNVTNNSGSLTRQKYSVEVSQFEQQILPTIDSNGKATGFGETTVWGFAAEAKNAITGEPMGMVQCSPGGTFEAIQGVPVQVNWTNNLVDSNGNLLTHLFKVDPTLNWANPNNMQMPNPGTAKDFPNGYPQAQSPVPICIHLHGAEVQSTSDGNPEAWWTANGLHGSSYNTYVPTSANSAVFFYPNTQEPTTLWYHDHSMGITRLNVMSGLAGFYILRSQKDPVANLLPNGEFEVPLAIQDRNFQTNGEFFFSTQGTNPLEHPYWNPTFLGNTIMVNGKVWPNMDVKQGQYRLRILDGSNSRFYTLHFSNNMPFTQIGSDGGYLKTPVTLDSLTIAPGERVDILVDFSNIQKGEKIILQNLDPTLTLNEQKTVGEIVQFSVVPNEGFHSKSLPSDLNPTLKGDFPTLPLPVKNRTLTLVEAGVFPQTTSMLLDGQPFDAPISEKPTLGTTEEWTIVNPTMNTHPIHLHLIQFQLVSRQTIAAFQYQNTWTALNGKPPLNHTTINVPDLESYFVGKPEKPASNEQCWKDTIQAPAGSITTIRIRFAPQDGSTYNFDPTVGPGYVWHCHILDHEDNEMMRPFEVTATSSNISSIAILAAAAVIAAIIVGIIVVLKKRQVK